MSFQGSHLLAINRACKLFRSPCVYYRRLSSTLDCCSTQLLQDRLPAASVKTNIRFKPLIITPRYFSTSRIPYSNNVTENEKGKPIAEKKENIVTIPNILTVSRIFMCPVLGYLVINSDFSNALWLFIIAGITDLVKITLFNLIILELRGDKILLHITVGWLDCSYISLTVFTGW